MGRNSRDDYQWLVDELLSLEEEEIEEEIEADEDQQWWEEDAEIRNPGWSYGVYEDDEDFDEEAAVLALTPKQRRKLAKQEKKQRKAEKKQRKKKQKGIGGLIFLALLELAGIFAIIWWWLQWLT